MEFDMLKAIVTDGGGWDKVALLVFDNAQLWVNEDEPLKESDFKNLGGGYVYKEKTIFRNGKTFEYDVEMYNYHPLDHLQSVVMGDIKKIDIQSRTDIIG